MEISKKIKNPVKIRLKPGSSVILTDSNNSLDTPLKPEIPFSEEHYGFVIIVDYNNKQKEFVYQTQCQIQAIGIKDGKLRIYEEHKKTPWVFNKNTAALEVTAHDKFILEELEDIIAENAVIEGPSDEPIFRKPIKIEIVENQPEQSVIIVDEKKHNQVALYPGAILSQPHYGFKLIIVSKDGYEEIAIPTENKIESIGQEDNEYGDIKIFEDGKYHPWTFNLQGNCIQEAHYNEYSRRDKAFILEKNRGK